MVYPKFYTPTTIILRVLDSERSDEYIDSKKIYLCVYDKYSS